MRIFDEFGNFFKTMRVYLFGRGLLSLILIGTAMATAGTASMLVPGLVAAGGLALSAVTRLYSQRLYENDMADLYRDFVAQQLGMDPREVTREHLKIAARDNEVIAEALARQRRINIISFATSALAAAATFGLLYFGLVHETVKGGITSFFADYLGQGTAANIAKLTSIGVVSGISSLILHNGLEEAIGYGSGLHLAAAHDLIIAMDREVKRGRAISREDVFAVVVAANQSLQDRISQRYGERYDQMGVGQKSRVLHDLGLAQTMDNVARAISEGKVRPGYLAYAVNDPRMTSIRVADRTPVTNEPAPVRGKFVERLGLAPRAETTHAARVEASRESAVAGIT